MTTLAEGFNKYLSERSQARQTSVDSFSGSEPATSTSTPQINTQLSEFARFLYEFATAELDVSIKADNPGADPYTQLVSNFCDDIFSFICSVDRLREGRA